MNIACPDCRSVFRVDPRKVPESGIRARCSVCGGIMALSSRGSIDDEFAAIGEGGSAPAFETYSAFFAETSPSGRDASLTQEEAVAGLPPSLPKAEPKATVASDTGTGDILVGAAAMTDEDFAAPARRSPTPPGVPLVPPAAPHRMTPGPQRTVLATPGAGQPAVTTTHSAADAGSAPAIPAATASVQEILPGSVPAAAPQQRTSPPWGKGPLNPYLASDPNMKARRLARVLVSDMVVYNPDKREEGLRSGTLKQLFREEIKKSYEEYIDQVGKEFAESTQHFQEALNDILAGGKRLF